MKKLVIVFTILFASMFLFNTELSAKSYNYSTYGEVIEQADSYITKKVLDNSNLVDTNNQKVTLGTLNDIISFNNKLYVSDETSNRIIVINEEYQVCDYFPKEVYLDDGNIDPHYKLNKPNGIFIKNNILYICDTENFRVVQYNLDTKEYITEINAPNAPIFDENEKGERLMFRPTKLTVDRTGRMFVIARDVYEGILDFDPDGNFNRFFGTSKVKMSVVEMLIFKLSSEEQKAKMSKKLQTSFTNLTLDSNGNVFALSSARSTDKIVKKLNNKGKDILEMRGYIPVIGDTYIVMGSDNVPNGASEFSDITVYENENRYSAIDKVRGRVFTYDREGNLLYICGQYGNQSNMFRNPTGVTYLGDNIVVCDSFKKSIVIFEPTEFGKLINEATDYYLNYDYVSAKAVWEKILKLNSNYYLAYAGIGKAQLREGNYEEALKNLKLGRDFYNYSQAYELYRSEKLGKILPYIIVGAIILLGGLFVVNIKNSLKRDKEGE